MGTEKVEISIRIVGNGSDFRKKKNVSQRILVVIES